MCFRSKSKLLVKSLLIGGFSLMLLSGCAKKHETEYVPLPEVYDTADKLLQTSFDNLKFPETLDITKTSKLYTFEGGWGNDAPVDKDYCVNAVKDIMHLLYDTDVKDSEVYKTDKYGSDDHYIYISDNREVAVNSPGKIIIADTMLHESMNYTNSAVLDLKSDYREKTYELNGEQVKIGEAEDYCNNVLKKLSPYLDANEELELQSVVIIKLADGSRAYQFVYNKKVKEISVSNECTYAMVKKGFSKPSLIKAVVDGKDHLYELMPFYPNDIVTDSFKEFPDDTKYVTLESAGYLLSDYLAPEHPYSVSDIDIKYACITHTGEGGGTPIERIFRPYWTFVLAEKNAEEPYVFTGKLMTTAYVDMITGEIYVVDDVGKNVFFEMK